MTKNASNSRARNPPKESVATRLVESATQGTLPADLIKSMIYQGKFNDDHKEHHYKLTEGEAAFKLNTPEEMTQVEELITNLSAAQIPYTLSDDEDTREVVLSWKEEYTDQIESTMEALGIEVYDDDSQTESLIETSIFKPQGEIKNTKPPYKRKPTGYLQRLSKKTQSTHARGLQPETPIEPMVSAMEQSMNVKEMIDSVINGESVKHLVGSFCESDKPWLKKLKSLGWDPTPVEVKQALSTYKSLNKKYGAQRAAVEVFGGVKNKLRRAEMANVLRKELGLDPVELPKPLR